MIPVRIVDPATTTGAFAMRESTASGAVRVNVVTTNPSGAVAAYYSPIGTAVFTVSSETPPPNPNPNTQTTNFSSAYNSAYVVPLAL